ncbi:MAG: iron-containing alcohol dehydrogenase, partial [Pseudomonadota bacterium]
LEGMRLVIENLPRAYDNGADIEARANMMSAAAMGAVAFQKGLGAIHALSHPVGALYHTHHGTTNAVFMPPVLRLNAPKIAARFDQAAGYLGLQGGFDSFCGFVDDFNARFSIPKTLSGLGIENPDLDRMVEAALRDPSCGGNPVTLTEMNLRTCYEAVL